MKSSSATSPRQEEERAGRGVFWAVRHRNPALYPAQSRVTELACSAMLNASQSAASSWAVAERVVNR